MKFGFLEAKEDIDLFKSNQKIRCECVCGKVIEAYKSNLTGGKSKSCGCHGNGIIPPDVRRTFTLMKYRCENVNSSDYPRWGAKGIKVMYKDMLEFYKDVGDKPSKKHSIDRIDNNKSYEIGNCRWATQEEQSNNTSNNVIVCFNGENMTTSQFAKKIGIKYSTVKERMKKGMNVEDIAITKVDDKKSKAGKSRWI